MSEPLRPEGDPEATRNRVSFGERDVASDEKQGLVDGVFSSVAGRYDLMNDLMSGGLHRVWKDALVTTMDPPRSDRRFHVLDVAGGTGDIAERILRAGGQGCSVTICDINHDMLHAGRHRRDTDPARHRLQLVTGNAEQLPLPDRSVDAYTIAFGIRNVTAIERALAEAYRVLRVGGRFLCLEFSHVDTPMIDAIYDAWSYQAIPRIGDVVTGDPDSYQYLVESIRRFPNQETFASMIDHAGFDRVSYNNFTFGVVAIHSGWRL